MCRSMQKFILIACLTVLSATITESQSVRVDEDNFSGENLGDQNNDTSYYYTDQDPIPSHTDKPKDVSQATMDVITIIWYLSTFLALAAFFFLMVCSDRRCGRGRAQNQQTTTQQAPPTPAPSYSEFAPPSYESVMKQSHDSIFVVPIHQASIPDFKTTTDIKFHTVNELAKIS